MQNPLHIQIEQYLDGTMPPDLRGAFEAQLAGDPGLASELRLHEAARAAVQVQALLDRREALYRSGRKKLFWRSWWWKTLDVLERFFVRQRPDGR